MNNDNKRCILIFTLVCKIYWSKNLKKKSKFIEDYLKIHYNSSSAQQVSLFFMIFISCASYALISIFLIQICFIVLKNVWKMLLLLFSCTFTIFLRVQLVFKVESWRLILIHRVIEEFIKKYEVLCYESKNIYMY